MDEILIKRSESLSVQGATKWAENGFIASIYQKELLFMKPKLKQTSTAPDEGDEGYAAATEITDLFEFPQRFSSEFTKLPNSLLDITTNNEEIRIGQTNLDYTPVEIEWSPTNYSSNNEPYLAIVTDHLHCFILERSGSKWTVKFNILLKIIGFADFDVKKILKPDQLAQLRINSFAWTSGISFQQANLPLLPITSRFFTVATESTKYVIYQVVGNDEITEKAKFIIDFASGEFAVNCKFSKWNTFDNSHLQCYLALTTNKNRVLLKTLLYNIKAQSLEVKGDEIEIRKESKKPISILEFASLSTSSVSEYTYFSYASTNEVELIKIDRSGKFTACKVTTGTYLLFNSLIQFVDHKDSSNVKLILSNTYRDLLLLTINMDEMVPLEIRLVNYMNLKGDNSPFVRQLRTSWEKGPQKITSISVDETGDFALIGLTPFDKNLTYDMRAIVDKDTIFTIVPLCAFEGPTIKEKFIELSKLSLFEKGMSSKYLAYELIKSFAAEDPHSRESSRLLFKDLDFEKIVADHTPTKVTLKTLTSILQELYRYPKVEAVVTALALSPPSEIELKKKCKSAILKLLGLTITGIDPSTLTSSNDILCYHGWVEYLKTENAAASTISEVSYSQPISLHIEDIDETEHFSNKGEFSLETIDSDEGHVWKRCSLTLVPLVSANVKVCRESDSKVNCDFKSDDILTKSIVDALPICIFSGARFEST